MRRKIMAVLFALMVLAGMGIQTEHIYAGDAASSPEAVPDQGDALEKYNALLTEWAYDKNMVDDVHADFPDYYGGAYLDGEQLVIQVTELSDAVKEELAGIISLENVAFEEVTYAYTELVAANDALVEALQDAEMRDALSAVAEMGVDIKDNSVYVGIAAAENSEAALRVIETCKEITDFENIKYRYDSSRVEPAAETDVASVSGDDAATGAKKGIRVIGYAVAGVFVLAVVVVIGVKTNKTNTKTHAKNKK